MSFIPAAQYIDERGIITWNSVQKQQKRKMQDFLHKWRIKKKGGHPLGTSTDIWMGVIRPVLLWLLFPRMWVWRGQAQEVCGRCGTQNALIHFLHLLWFLQLRPRTFLAEHGVGVSLPGSSCVSMGRARFSSVGFSGRVSPGFSATFSCSLNNTSSILVCRVSNILC